MSFIGKNIKKIRSVKQLSQQQLSDILGVSRASVGSYEEGRAEPKIDTIIRLAKHFSISIDALLTREITVNDILHFKLTKERFPFPVKSGPKEEVSSKVEEKPSMEDRLARLEAMIEKLAGGS